jgi:predicted NUDIX family NTP pyrophosphohydrolase
VANSQWEFPEVDRAAWFEIEEAKRKIHQGQVPLIEELERMVSEKRVYG